MEYQTFINNVQAELSKEYSATATVSVEQCLRNNNVVLDTITIKNPNCNIAPTIHLSPYYSRFLEGVSFDDILEDIKKTYEYSARTEDFNISHFTDYNKAKYRIGMRLINTKRNTELLKDLPHVDLLDLSIVFDYQVSEFEEMNAAILIHKNHLDFWEVTEEELFEQAKDNAPALKPCTFESLEAVIADMFPEDMPEEFPPVSIYCLSNQSRTYGASALVYEGLLEGIAQRFHSNLTIIPSSVHELLIIPEENPDPLSLESMICQVNEMELKETEILSDHPYFYNFRTGELSL